MKIFTLLLFLLLGADLCAQKYFTRTATIEFNSETPLERIQAINGKAVSVIDMEANQLQFSVLMKGFHFDNALMQVHFNENYVLSDQHPKATFRSTEADLSSLDVTKPGAQLVTVRGLLEIKGVTQEVEAPVTFEFSETGFSGSTSLEIVPSDFDIEIPKIVRNKIAKTIFIQVNANYELYQKS